MSAANAEADVTMTATAANNPTNRFISSPLRVDRATESQLARTSRAHLFQHRLRMPAVTLATKRSTPSVQGVVDYQGNLQKLLVVTNVSPKTQRDCQQTGCLR